MGRQALTSNTTGVQNDAVGYNALASNTTGSINVAVGDYALVSNTTGVGNVGLGSAALGYNTSGNNNIALGNSVMVSNTSGSENIAIGVNALYGNTIGNSNIALGLLALVSNNGSNNIGLGNQALQSVQTGSGNLALGANAGSALAGAENNNVDIANAGITGESSTIRIGTVGTQTKAFIAGIRGVTTGVANGITVLIDGNGQLGTVSSSRRFKTDVRDMGDASSRLMRLRPVTFKYKPELDPSGTTQYGVIAEEVEQVFPDLVARDKDGKIETVKYHLLSALLLNEVHKQYRQQRAQAEQIYTLRSQYAQLAQLQRENAQLARDNAALRERLGKIEQVVEHLASRVESMPAHVAGAAVASDEDL